MSHVRRFDHVGLTVADLDVVTAFFVALGLEVEGRTFVEGASWNVLLPTMPRWHPRSALQACLTDDRSGTEGCGQRPQIIRDSAKKTDPQRCCYTASSAPVTSLGLGAICAQRSAAAIRGGP
jgi:hypothetical protein